MRRGKQACIHESHVVETPPTLLDFVRQIHAIAADLRPNLVYYPSIGMASHAVFLAESAPRNRSKWRAMGHPATTFSPCIDYAIIEEDYIGDPRCFSERVGGSTMLSRCLTVRAPIHPLSSLVLLVRTIARFASSIAATVMKVNGPFLATLRRIADESTAPVEFHFFSGAARGLAKIYLQNVVHRFLPGRAVVYPQVPYESYLRNLNGCDCFLSLFRSAATNTIVDAVLQGLPGVCLNRAGGPRAHGRGPFKRLGLPEWLIARSTDEYVKAAKRLIDDKKERA